jgi:hypothetical protein
MELQTKFIKGTDEQYSIREDGVVISHYRICFSSLYNKSYKIVKDKMMKTTADHRVGVCIEGKKTSVSTIQLLIEYFNFHYCKKCNSKIYKYFKIPKRVCDSCITEKRYAKIKERHLADPEKYKQIKRKYREANPEKYAEYARRTGEKMKDNLNRCYIASCLNISVKELTEELYEHHKKLIMFKRQVAQEHNINIEKLV